MTIPAPSFIEFARTQMEARFEDGISVNLSRGNSTGRIYAYRPFLRHMAWEPTGLTEAQVRDYQKAALLAFTSGAGRIDIDYDGDLFAVLGGETHAS